MSSERSWRMPRRSPESQTHAHNHWISEMHQASSTTYQNSLRQFIVQSVFLFDFLCILSGPMQNWFFNPGIIIWFGWFSSSGQYPALVATYTHHLHSLPLIHKVKCSLQTLFWLQFVPFCIRSYFIYRPVKHKSVHWVLITWLQSLIALHIQLWSE